MNESDRVTLAMFPLDMALLWAAGATAMVAVGSFGMGGFFAACSASMVGLYRLKVRRMSRRRTVTPLNPARLPSSDGHATNPAEK